MSLIDLDFSSKERRTIVFAVTFGNTLEWYEIFLYIYWSPILSKLFFQSDSELVSMMNLFLVFAIGFLARPLGGIFFGRIGDHFGRKKALICSILMMTLPTIVIGLLPTYQQIGFFAPILLGFMRFLQSFPAGGELPGAACYLYESARADNQKYMCSWGAVGLQAGILLSTIECFILEKFVSAENLAIWGWRLSFLIGGLIGLFGLYLRTTLHETPVYREMVKHERHLKQSLSHVLSKHKKAIFSSILYCALNSSVFYLLTVDFPVYFGKLLGFDYQNNLLISIALLLIITLPLPFFGKLAGLINYRKLLIYSTLGLIFLLLPLHYVAVHTSIIGIAIFMLIYCLLFTILSALVPFLLSNAFPTPVRFTCVGFSFNIADAIIGGFTPFITIFLTWLTGSHLAVSWYILFCSILSLISYYMLPKREIKAQS